MNDAKPTGSNGETVTLTDNTTGKSLELPILGGSVGPKAIDVSKLYAQTGYFTYDPGFTSTASCDSNITYIDGEVGILMHRGYLIEELAEHSDFMDVCYLLLHGELPNTAEKESFEKSITYHTMLHEQMNNFFRGFRRDSHPMAVLVGVVAFWFWLERTKIGKILRSIIHDREVSEAMGVNVRRMFTITFMIGAALGAIAGGVTAPIISVVPGVGVEVIVVAFAVVVTGGLGSITGAAIGALIVGLARAISIHTMPELELFIVYAVMAAVLIFRPHGLFGQAVARKI